MVTIVVRELGALVVMCVFWVWLGLGIGEGEG